MSDISLLRALYRPDKAIPVPGLTDLGDALQAQFLQLAEDPTPERYQAVIANLDGVRRAVIRMSAEASTLDGAA